MVRKYVTLADAELEIEDIEKLSLDPSYIAFAENACADRPMDVLQSRIIQILYRY